MSTRSYSFSSSSTKSLTVPKVLEFICDLPEFFLNDFEKIHVCRDLVRTPRVPCLDPGTVTRT